MRELSQVQQESKCIEHFWLNKYVFCLHDGCVVLRACNYAFSVKPVKSPCLPTVRRLKFRRLLDFPRLMTWIYARRVTLANLLSVTASQKLQS